MAYHHEVAIAWEEHGSGAPLLLIHGLGYGRWGWEPLLPLLSDHFRVIIFDNRGIGDSSVPPGAYSAATMAGDAAAVLDAAGVRSAHVVGTSLGGMIAQELAVDRAHQVDRLVLMSTTPGGSLGHPMPEVTARLIADAPSWEPEVALRRFIENALRDGVEPDIIERILQHRLANPQNPTGWMGQAAAGTTYNGEGRVSAIRAPTLVLHGTADRVVDCRNAELLASLIPGAQLRLFPDAGHLFFWEDPASVAETINESLQ